MKSTITFFSGRNINSPSLSRREQGPYVLITNESDDPYRLYLQNLKERYIRLNEKTLNKIEKSVPFFNNLFFFDLCTADLDLSMNGVIIYDSTKKRRTSENRVARADCFLSSSLLPMEHFYLYDNFRSFFQYRLNDLPDADEDICKIIFPLLLRGEKENAVGMARFCDLQDLTEQGNSSSLIKNVFLSEDGNQEFWQVYRMQFAEFLLNRVLLNSNYLSSLVQSSKEPTLLLKTLKDILPEYSLMLQ